MGHQFLRLRKNALEALCITVITVIVVAGLWPFNFWPENKVKWLKDQNGVQFCGRGIIYSTIPLFQSSDILNKSITIEIWLQPERESHDHIACILSFYDVQSTKTISINQWKTTLIFQKSIQTYNDQSSPKVGIEYALLKNTKRLFTITSGMQGTRIYIDGKVVKYFPKFNLFSGTEKESWQLILGNSPTGKGYWTGNLLGLAIYNRQLTEEQTSNHFNSWEKSDGLSLSKGERLGTLYFFDEHSGCLANDHAGRHPLLVPPKFSVLQKTILARPWIDFKLNRSYLMDILTNILGFIPIGFALHAYLWIKKSQSIYPLFFISILFPGFLSLAIELAQVYLPTRSSQLMDIITNLLGTTIGVELFLKYRKVLSTSRE